MGNVEKLDYVVTRTLPDSVKAILPSAAQEIFTIYLNLSVDNGFSEERAFIFAWKKLMADGWEKAADGTWFKVERGDIIFKVGEMNEEKRLVFGWASMSKTKTGESIVDTQGDIIQPDELEKGAYLFVKNSRVASEMHEKMGVGRLVESMVFTKEKQAALGIPEGQMPIGWWVGFEVDADIFEKVKDGTYSAFSIGGRGQRKEIED